VLLVFRRRGSTGPELANAKALPQEPRVWHETTSFHTNRDAIRRPIPRRSFPKADRVPRRSLFVGWWLVLHDVIPFSDRRPRSALTGKRSNACFRLRFLTRFLGLLAAGVLLVSSDSTARTYSTTPGHSR
jgi:hypothetical protein